MIHLKPEKDGWFWHVDDEQGKKVNEGFSRTFIHAATTAEDAFWKARGEPEDASEEEPRQAC